MLVPIREMTDVLSVESKTVDLSRNTWVRMKIGTYKGDLAKVYVVPFIPRKPCLSSAFLFKFYLFIL